MLVLSRKSQETVVIGGFGSPELICKVTVLDIKGGKVRLGFDVAAEIPVNRLEVWERIQAGGDRDGPTEGHKAPVA